MALPLAHRAMRAPSMAALATLESALSSLRITSIVPAGRRHASHQAQGRANKAKQGPGKRLGAKKTGGQYVVPGNILYKQRGTKWYPGDGCFMVSIRTVLRIPVCDADGSLRAATTRSMPKCRAMSPTIAIPPCTRRGNTSVLSSSNIIPYPSSPTPSVEEGWACSPTRCPRLSQCKRLAT